MPNIFILPKMVSYYPSFTIKCVIASFSQFFIIFMIIVIWSWCAHAGPWCAQGFQRFTSSHFRRSFSCTATKSIKYEKLLIFCYPSYQNGQPWTYIGSKLWDSIPSHMKEKDSINESDLCSCRLCKVYLQNIGYLQPEKKT